MFEFLKPSTNRNNIDKKQFIRNRIRAVKTHKLNYIFWEATLRCNISCRHCGSDCFADNVTPDMPYQDFLRAVDEIGDIISPEKTTIAIIGGEPLLRGDLEDVGYELKKRGLFFGIVTNGMLLSRKRLCSLMNSGLRSLSVSLDGLRNTHNWLRNSEKSWVKAIEAISYAVQQPDLVFDVITCVHKRNLNQLPMIRDFLIERKVPSWRLFSIFPRGRAVFDKELILDTGEIRILFDFIVETKKEKRIDANYGCEGYAGDYELKIRDYPFFCISGINVASVLADGSISGCPSTRDDFIQGNIYHDNFRECWEKRFKDYRDRRWMMTGLCGKCPDFAFCNGGSLHLRTSKNELFYCHHMIKDQYCSSAKFPEMVIPDSI